MENEKVAIEAIAEEGARAYSKTVWTETTPITADKLNKMENGIADASMDIAKCLPLTGGTLTGNLAFSNIGTGGGLNANIHNLALHSNTGNGQMLTADANRIYVGNPETNLTIESSSNPVVKVGQNTYQLYHTGNKPTAGQIGAMSTNGPTFEGNLNQNGPGGKDWVYHINADRGTLNIAPKENGSPNWGKQIYFDRNGQMYCNGNRRVATINQENPAHYMIRYGSGMGGADGYITFSW